MNRHISSELARVLLTCFENVPFYHREWTEAGLSTDDFRRDDPKSILPNLPVLAKDDVRRDPWAFVARDGVRSAGLRQYLTSGSTGTPVTAIWNADDHRRFIAAREARSFNWAGTSLLKSRSMIGGRIVVPKADSKPPFHRYNAFERQVYLSAFHISPATVAEYVRALNKFRPAVLTGYAHSHFTLGRLMIDRGLALSYRPDALVLSSEKITPHMRQIIERAFGARVFEEYGCVENCVLATECEEGRLHVSSDFGVVELLDDDGTHVPPGEDGRIVCTGLLNRNQFLIRYEVGDTGRWAGTVPVRERSSSGVR